MNKPELSVLEKLHSETATIAWRELQRFFAQGAVIVVDSSLDLVATAVLFAEDNVNDLESLIESDKAYPPTNDQARSWYDTDAELWTVVVAPYVLVQEK